MTLAIIGSRPEGSACCDGVSSRGVLMFGIAEARSIRCRYRYRTPLCVDPDDLLAVEVWAWCAGRPVTPSAAGERMGRGS